MLCLHAMQATGHASRGNREAAPAAVDPGAASVLYLYGSAASRKPSPKKLKASTTVNTGTTGSISQG